MSATLDRILAAARAHSLRPSAEAWEVDDTDGDGTVSIGEWKDAITVELKALKTYLETVAELSTGRDPEITKQAIFRVTKDL